MIPRTISKYSTNIIQPSPEMFFGKLFHIRDVVHLTHLRQPNKSGWQHSALNTLYDEIIDQIDGLIEAYQGIYGVLDITIPESKSVQEPISFIQEMYSCIQKDRYMFTDSWMQNEIDNLCKLLAQTMYRLKFVQ
jgi:hypothetical protein